MYSYIGFFIVLFLVFMYLFYIANKKSNVKEGFEGFNIPDVAKDYIPDGYKDNVAKMRTAYEEKKKNLFSINIPNVASSAKDYVAKLTIENEKMKNLFLIKQYKKDYEQVIIEMDEYVNYVSMLYVLQMDTENKEKMTKQLSTLNSLQDARKSLNEVMRFVDKQK